MKNLAFLLDQKYETVTTRLDNLNRYCKCFRIIKDDVEKVWFCRNVLLKILISNVTHIISDVRLGFRHSKIKQGQAN